jgi:hypothetical protein
MAGRNRGALMYVFAGSAASSNDLSAGIAQLAGALAMLLLVFLLVRKYVFKKDDPQIGRRKKSADATPATAADSAVQPGAGTPAASPTILPGK